MHKLIGGTRAQFRTCKAHYLARSVGRPKTRYTGDTVEFELYSDVEKDNSGVNNYVG